MTHSVVEARRILVFRKRLTNDLCGCLAMEATLSKLEKEKLEDKIVLEKAKINHELFGILYEKYKLKIFNYILYRASNNPETAEDLTQETFIRALKALDRFQYQNCTYFAYLVTIAHNLLINHYRSQKTLSLDNMIYLPQEATSESKKESEVRLDMGVLWNFVKHLTRQEQKVMEMKYQKDASVKTIAMQLNKSPNAIKIILSRARKKLKKKCEACVRTLISS